MALIGTPTVRPQELHDLFTYDPMTGDLRWRKSSSFVRAGDIAGFVSHRNYRQVRIKRRPYYVHRIVWAMTTGNWPEKSIDHKDGDASNNKWVNLREATPRENVRNIGLRRTNTSGFIGVSYDKINKLWKARARTESGQKHLGAFSTKEAAAEAAESFRVKHHGEFRRA